MTTAMQPLPVRSAERPRFIRWFDEIGVADVADVGGKNASLGELTRALVPLGVSVPTGFAITAAAYRHLIEANDLAPRIDALLREADASEELEAASASIRALVAEAPLPLDLEGEILDACRELAHREHSLGLELAVRSSATAEDLPGASFAGAHSTVLNVRGEAEVLGAVRTCFASLWNARAINYRDDMGFAHDAVALSVGVQTMVRSGEGVSGVMFTLDTESGFRDVVQIDAIWGLGENIVQGRVGPDEWYVHKPLLERGFRPIVGKKLGTKEQRMVFDPVLGRHDQHDVSVEDRSRFCLDDDEVLQLARWAAAIERHYSEKAGKPTPMDIEFAKDGIDGRLFVVQARPETVHSMRTAPTLQLFELEGTGSVLVSGLAVGDRIATGTARVVRSAKEIARLEPGEVLVTETTDPDWEPIMKSAAAIVTEHGGRTSHAAIVAREIGIPAIVGAADAVAKLTGAGAVTVSCAEGETGNVYEGSVPFRVDELDPTSVPATRTKILVNVGDPEQAFKTAMLPNDGIGLARMEFIFAGWVRVHPLALTRYDTLDPQLQHEIDELTKGYADKREFFVDTLSRGIATLAAAFWPKPVILRFSDFKTNEYAHLLGGAAFEPTEENPMIGWRGASRYYHPDYKEGFLLEVAAVKRVREAMGLTNLVVMIPFCRTPQEGRKVLDVMREGGLVRGEHGLEVYVMAEIPSNIVVADQFAEIFDGFSIGSNDLTQLTLGVDRDSHQIASLFDERHDAVLRSCASLIETAHRFGRKVGICGQAPSDYPEFAAFLVEHGIDSISLNPDSVMRTKRRIHETEERLAGR